MNIFFKNWEEIGFFLEKLLGLRCPVCGASGSLGKHGFIWGFVEGVAQLDIRARRIHCRRKKGGCGRTWSLRPGDRLFRYCFSTKQGWAFLRELMRGRSVKAA